MVNAKRITGKQLTDYTTKDVILLGQIKKISSNGKGIEMSTTDNVLVNVNLPEPINEVAEGYIEVYGTAMSRSTVSCKSYIIIPPEMSDNFETDKYNALLSTLLVIESKKWKINAEDDPL
ncbi:uncharacterized protein LOC131666245 [Phymastichus coffea]|uniref:uncharacterized protein LOC131666245 n=1 Tax=Phymastichus coffea TaxID=108790 RepID=UPI00273AC5FB|nr:uncharacterized protein LOC131666245 [Phymastichus coffea]